MSAMKQCLQGHYYMGDSCPYCRSGKNAGEAAANGYVKVCSNHHAYSTKLSRCPICGSTVVADKYESGRDTVSWHIIRLAAPISVKVQDQDFSDIAYLIVMVSRGNKIDYLFSNSKDWMDGVGIKPDESIQFGDTLVEGRELMRMCDVILDNHMSFLIHKVGELTKLED